MPVKLNIFLPYKMALHLLSFDLSESKFSVYHLLAHWLLFNRKIPPEWHQVVIFLQRKIPRKLISLHRCFYCLHSIFNLLFSLYTRNISKKESLTLLTSFLFHFTLLSAHDILEIPNVTL